MALRYADAIARRAKARLTVLYVNDPLLIAAATTALRDRHFVERSRRELQAFVHATLPSPERIQTCLGAGHPANEILRIAGRAGVDLLVVGTEGLTGAERVLIGSTALGVLRRTTVPVLVVPRRGDDMTTEMAPSWPGERIIAAVDLDRTARQDVTAVTEIARWFQAHVLLLHVVQAVSIPAWMMPNGNVQDRIRIAQQQLDHLVAGANPEVETQARVVYGRPADEIAATAAAERVQLVVTALRDRRGWFGPSRGSVSYHVLSHVVTPVLTYPPQWRFR